jgi:Tol biopolymer transport system component
MPIANGDFIGPYQILGWLGAGGMGVVYRARDSRLAREVAIKLIPEAAAMDAGRVHRFEQEARGAGQLNHPNILAVYDVGTHSGTPYLVSELLEGATLRSLLSAGALTPRRAVDYARQTAEGLAAAHDKAIVHRDVKPDNLFITHEGRVKILDFGIAKLTGTDEEPGRTGSPTDTAPGLVLGTVGYMSPEQIRGEPVDSRSDIFNCGTVLYEMLTGRPAFARGTAAEVMAAILKDDPTGPLPTAVPPALERIVSRCLEKARQARFQSARDLAFGLDVLTGTSPIAAIDAVSAHRRIWWRQPLAAWAVAAALAVALALALWRSAALGNTSHSTSLHISAELGTDATLAPLNVQFGGAATISPDGETLAFVAQRADERPQMYLRRLDQLQALPLAGTDDALAPFFSPDGQWIGFFGDGKLKKIAITGGAAIVLADAPSTRGGAWSDDNTIVFSPHQMAGTHLLRVSSEGGDARAITTLGEGEAIHLWPQVLPGGTALLYTSASAPGAYDEANIVLQQLPSGTRKVLQRGGYHGRYLPSGHLVYIHDGTLFAVRFDLRRQEVRGLPVPMLEGLASNSITGGAQFAVSASGTAVYLPGPTVGGGTPLHWMDPEGKTIPLRPISASWTNVLFAPDGQRLVMDISEGGSADIWLLEWVRGGLTRVTLDPAEDRQPVWAPDGKGIAFASNRGDKATMNLYWQRTDGTGKVERLTISTNHHYPTSWHPSGRYLLFSEESRPLNVDVMVLPLEAVGSSWRVGKPSVLLNGPSIESDAVFSPDGRWIAYSSNESGRPEVYVQPFPGPGAKRLISTGGGISPTWSRSKQELFYGVNGRIMVAAFTVAADTFHSETPRLWSEGRYQTRGSRRMFDLHPDGERLALAPAPRTPGRSNPDSVVFVFNFFDELRGLTSTTSR